MSSDSAPSAGDANDVNRVLLVGMLYKKGGMQGSWEERYFVLTNDACLRYYACTIAEANASGACNSKLKGVIDLEKACRCTSSADTKQGDASKGFMVRMRACFPLVHARQ